jgi:methylated-DNA-[protein]-cysteine S-methyltransferase
VRPVRHAYEVPGWGRGEIWLRGPVLVHHELDLTVTRVNEDGATAGISIGTVSADACATEGAVGRGRAESGLRSGRQVADQGPSAEAAASRAPAGARAQAPRRPSLSAMSTVAQRTHPPTGGNASPLRIVADEVLQECSDLASDLRRRFAAHLCGERVEYGDIQIDLDGRTPLQRALAEALRTVPWGEVVTYGELAALAGRPGAARAAGTFCAESTWSLVVPCHRVVGASGIGGYGPSGVTVKRRLLAVEGVEL